MVNPAFGGGNDERLLVDFTELFDRVDAPKNFRRRPLILVMGQLVSRNFFKMAAVSKH